MEKEPEKQAKANKKNRRYKKFIYVIIAVLLIVLIICDYVFLIRKSKVLAPSSSNNKEQAAVNESSNTSTQEKTLTANDYYQSGVSDFIKKDYNSSISNLSKAIELDPKNIDYYKIKSAAENNLGEKDDAISTVKEGLKINPNDQLLLSRVDSLQKKTYNNQTNDGRN
jgi:tetratricopeptide (TPR) repeat protein